MNGNPDDPLGESWGGSFARINHSSRAVFRRNTTTADTVVAYGVQEWVFIGPELDISEDSVCFTMEISNQIWPGYYQGNGSTGFAIPPKSRKSALMLQAVISLNWMNRKVSLLVFRPGRVSPSPDDYKLGSNWYSDRPEPELFLDVQQGARTVSKYREEFLSDWALRWEWLESP